MHSENESLLPGLLDRRRVNTLRRRAKLSLSKAYWSAEESKTARQHRGGMSPSPRRSQNPAATNQNKFTLPIPQSVSKVAAACIHGPNSGLLQARGTARTPWLRLSKVGGLAEPSGNSFQKNHRKEALQIRR